MLMKNDLCKCGAPAVMTLLAAGVCADYPICSFEALSADEFLDRAPALIAEAEAQLRPAPSHEEERLLSDLEQIIHDADELDAGMLAILHAFPEDERQGVAASLQLLRQARAKIAQGLARRRQDAGR